jgi:lipopolysaccharide export system permease protein
MGRILNRYLALEILVPFGFGIVVFTFVLLIARILKMVEMVVNRGVPLLDMMKVFSLILPAFLEVTVPMALLLGILLGFGRLSADNEVVALKTSGVSLLQMTVPVAGVVALTTLLAFVIASWVRPWSNAALKQALFDLVKTRASAGFKPNVFNNDFPGLVIYVEEIEPGGLALKGILIADVRDPENRNTVVAKIGLLLPDEETKTVTLRLLDGSIYGINVPRRTVNKTDFNVYDFNLNLNAFGDLQRREPDPKEMTLGELWKRISALQARGDPGTAERIELHRKFSIPAACLLLALVGIPLGLQPVRAVRSRGFALSLVLIFLYYVPLTVGETLAKKEWVAPAVGLWLPNFGFLLLGGWLFWRAAKEAPLGSSGRLEAIAASLRARRRSRRSAVPSRPSLPRSPLRGEAGAAAPRPLRRFRDRGRP